MAAESSNLSIAVRVIYCNHRGCHWLSDNSLRVLCQQRLLGHLYLLAGAHSGEKDGQKDPQTEHITVTGQSKDGHGAACC